MTEIKIPFTKNKIEKISADKLNANCKGLELGITTDFKIGEGLGIDLTKCHGGTPENTFSKMVFVFKDDAESSFYDDLFDSNKTNFELSFDREKVFLVVGGFHDIIDKTKPEVQVYPAPQSRLMTVFFDKKFAGIIKLNSTSEKPNKPQKTDEQKKIEQLQAKVNELEEKLRQKPDNSDTSQKDEKIKLLKKELSELKEELKNLKNQSGQPEKFP